MRATEALARLTPLAQATEIRYEADLAVLRRITRKESQLRDSLSELEDQAAAGFLRAVGSETGSLGFASSQERAWRDWLSMKRGELQRNLALCLAEKSEQTEVLRLSMGRRDVAVQMVKRARAEARQDRLAKQMAALQEMSLLHHRKRPRK